ncbi:hypothetical protein A5791_16675, partial [Mycobacterium sp. 852002-51163_SCH5372311]|uniref:hypothetical protein n=1 Tax=Mycobacterium sp. 852002-51163_SCH5372311 TaxID=1834097 RepID=UPI0007FDA915
CPGYGPPPGYGAPGGYGFPPGFGPPPLAPGAVKPGIIPLRPLNLSDIFNGAVGYIRANPKATIGLTAAVVLVMQIISYVATLGPLAAASRLKSAPAAELSWADAAGWMLGLGGSVLVAWLGGILLSGMLTVVVGRAVFGSPITIGEAWARIRGRLPALIGLSLLEGAGAVAIIGLAAVLIAGAATVGHAALAVLVAFPLVLIVIALLAYLYIALLFAPVLIVLERLPVFEAIGRSFALVRNGFWRVLGIWLLATLATNIVAGAVGMPFSIAGQVMLSMAGRSSLGMLILGTTLASIGSALGQILTAPFSAGVVVLLYTDRRIRAEAFDLVLQTGAAGGPSAGESTDHLWLTRPV